MAEKKTRILLRSDLVARWEEVNPVLLKGELGIAYNPLVKGYERVRIKIGDGVANWKALPYVADYDAKIAELENEIQEAVAALEAKLAKKVDKELIGDLGKSLLFNEKDGGGAKFEGNNGVNAYVGIHDNIGGEIGAQIYVDKANGEESTIIDVTQNGAYYTKGEIKPGAQRDVAENEIAVKGDLEGKADKADVEEALAGKVDKVEGSSLMSAAEHAKLEGVEEGAQVNKIEEVKLSSNFLEIKHDVEGHGPYVDLGNIATSGAIEAEKDRAMAAEEALGERIAKFEAEGDLDVAAIKDRVAVIEGKEAGWDDKYTKNEIDSKVAEINVEVAKKANAADVYTKTEVDGKLDAKANVGDSYLKSETYSKAEVNAELAKKQDVLGFEGEYDKASNKVVTRAYLEGEIAKIKQFKYQVVDELPAPSADCMGIIYLVPKVGKVGYVEWICIDLGESTEPRYKFEEIGDTDIDLSEYRKAAAQDIIDNEIKGLISSEVSRAEGALDERIDGVEDDIDGLADRVSAIEGKPAMEITDADISNWNGEIGAKAAVEAEVTRATGKEAELATAISNEADARESADNSLQLGIDGLNSDLSDEITRAKDKEAELEAAIETLDGKAHEHANKAELDLVQSGDVAKWNAKQDAISVGDNLKFANNKIELDFDVLDGGSASDWND